MSEPDTTTTTTTPDDVPFVTDNDDDDDNDDNNNDERICNMKEQTNASRRKEDGFDSHAQEKQMRALLSSAEDIESMDHFTYWKDQFLTEFRNYCDPNGTATARETEEALYAQIEDLGRQCLKVKELLKSGAITAEKSTVKGQNALNEMIAMMAKTETSIRDFMPKVLEDEEKVGYTKFELAAVLIRDGFRVYGIMITTRDYILSLSQGPLAEGDILKANSKSIMNFYLKSIDSFCDTMADLGLHKLMTKCVELFSIRPRKKKKKLFVRGGEKDPLSDTSDEEAPNKGRMFRRSKQDFKAVMDNGWTSGTTREQRKAPAGAKKLKGKTTWGEDEEEDQVAEQPQEKEKETDYIYYLDPVTEKIGKIPRTTCLQQKMILTPGEDGNEIQEGKVEEWDGAEGQAMMIWKFKEILKGKSLKEKGAK